MNTFMQIRARSRLAGRWLLLFGLVPSLMTILACAKNGPADDPEAQRRMLSLLMPQRIEVVEPFTRIKSFDDGNTPDGVELLVQAINALDNPGLMVVGRMHVELYEFVPASGDHRGRQLERWDIDLSTVEKQRTYWNPLTQMYEFRLGADLTRIQPAEKYLMTVTYTSPLGQHLNDEFLLRFDLLGLAGG